MVDGPRLVAEVLGSELEVEEIFAAPGELADLALERPVDSRIGCYEVDPSVLASVLDPVTPRLVAAVVRLPSPSLDEVVAADGAILVAVELRDPGNLGTVIRTAEAAGLAGVVVAGESVDRYAPKVVRASAGSLFRLPVAGADDPVALVEALRAAGRTVAAAVVDTGAEPYDRIDLSGAAIVIGNEPHGLPATVVEAATAPVTIPMADGVESLNVGAAASVLCFEAARQRRCGDPVDEPRRRRNPVDSHRTRSEGVHNEPRRDEPTPDRPQLSEEQP